MFFCMPVNNWELDAEPGQSATWDQFKVFYKKFVQALKGVSGKTWLKLQKWILVDTTTEKNLESFSDLAFYYYHNSGKDLNANYCFQNQKYCCKDNNLDSVMRSTEQYEFFDKGNNIFTTSSFENHNPCKVKKKIRSSHRYPDNMESSNSLHSFFESIANTMKTMPPVIQAHLRLQIAQLVFSQELKLLQYESTTSFENNS